MLLELVEKPYNNRCFFVSHGLMAGQTKLALVNMFCDGQAERVPLLVALLLVRRNGVVDEGLYAVLVQIAARTKG